MRIFKFEKKDESEFFGMVCELSLPVTRVSPALQVWRSIAKQVNGEVAAP
jgi:hypothetical protein